MVFFFLFCWWSCAFLTETAAEQKELEVGIRYQL